jgi:hypothetical protein
MPSRRPLLARFQGQKGRRNLFIVAGVVGTALVVIALSCAVLVVGAELWAERSVASGATPTEPIVATLSTVPPVTDTPSATPTPSSTPTATPTPTHTSTPTVTATSTRIAMAAAIQRQVRADAPAAAPTGEHHKKKHA